MVLLRRVVSLLFWFPCLLLPHFFRACLSVLLPAVSKILKCTSRRAACDLWLWVGFRFGFRFGLGLALICAIALEIKLDRGSDEIYQSHFINLFAFVDINGTPRISLQARVE